ncbi:Chloride channel protein [Rhodovulum sp. PH10]|uniref:chloride channel protein n=1 Tax=Rhodovulum sp. PH10 TaxID=1187851 RepID=UPI00027C25CB|nr:chloride channel protein [Rhodovulum sp. PH10]EJW13400.1 Chloride channel protein [Rhodovulum sp. PH10]
MPRSLLHVVTDFEIPHTIRVAVRSREAGLVLLAAIVGVVAGVVVAAMGVGVQTLHAVFFGLPPGARLSAQPFVDPVVVLSVPSLGGLMLGLAFVLIKKRRPKREIDPIEANALHGGRMSVPGSVIVAAQTVWSSGVGASVGLEAGYTQLASGLASRLGIAFRLRRADLRTLAGCGAAAAIAGAFGAPLAGAFYAFELVIGNYSIAGLAPVGVASVVGWVVATGLAPSHLGVVAPGGIAVENHDLVAAAGLGLLAALVGIALMRGVTLCETAFVKLKVPAALRPAIGGLLVGLLALVTPKVLSSGHGALHVSGALGLPLAAVALVFVLKALASIASLGSGFRGGLFFSSLLLGALFGQIFAEVVSRGLAATPLAVTLDPSLYALIGMTALSSSVIGGPLTMAFIALESTGDLWLTAPVLIAVILASQVTREIFGYSFATWRFHVRGESIRSAADIGWIRELTVGVMMRPDVRTAPADLTVAAFRETFPPGSTGQVVMVEPDGRYAGLVVVPEAHVPTLYGGASVREIIRHVDDVLVPSMTVQQAIRVFESTEADVLAVVESDATRRVVGQLSEAHALRRYMNELELRRRELLGERRVEA